MAFSSEQLVSQILLDYVEIPDYSNLMEDINDNHGLDFVTLKSDGICPETGNPWLPQLFKVLFTTSDTIIVQQVLMTFDTTRFRVRKIHAEEWADFFESWLKPGDKRYLPQGKFPWENGCRMYGARC